MLTMLSLMGQRQAPNRLEYKSNQSSSLMRLWAPERMAWHML